VLINTKKTDIILSYMQNVYKLGESMIAERDIIQTVVFRLIPTIIIYIIYQSESDRSFQNVYWNS